MAATFPVPGSFATPQIAINAIPNDLSGQGENKVIIDKGSRPGFTANGFSNESAIDFVSVVSKVGDEHKGIPGAGVKLTTQMSIGVGFFRCENIEVVTSSTPLNMLDSVGGAPNSTFINLMLETAAAGNDFGMRIQNLSDNCTFITSRVWNSGVEMSSNFGGWNCETGCTGIVFINCNGWGFPVNFFGGGGAGDTATCINCASRSNGSTPASVKAFRNIDTLTTCASHDNTGSAGLINLTDEQFGFVDEPNGDFHINSGSILNGAGTDQSGTFTEDIDLETIDTSDWPVGFDYLIPSDVGGGGGGVKVEVGVSL